MGNENEYRGLDLFRYIAALLVIAIHTYPLEQISPAGEFILTRIIARTAVPFFLMTTGAFLLREGCGNKKVLGGFIRKTGLIYLASIIIYLPLNFYNGYFSPDNGIWERLKNLLFDGTFYHLWYLPASILGGILSFAAISRLGYKKAFVIAAVLYVIGLFGDSYYGAIKGIASLKGLYDIFFTVSEYTRNGFFYAPVFMITGGLIMEGIRSRTAEKGKSSGGHNIRIEPKKYFLGLVLSMYAMTAEGLVLNCFGLQRHDSMYFFLLPVMFFLFSLLTLYKGKRVNRIRRLAMVIYVIHPMVIVAVRFTGKLLRLENLLIYNSLAHYIAVALGSTAIGIFAAIIAEKYGKRRAVKGQHLRNAEK